MRKSPRNSKKAPLLPIPVENAFYRVAVDILGLFQLFRPLFLHKTTFWSANYSACVVYTETIIHLSVGESDGYLPRRFAAR